MPFQVSWQSVPIKLQPSVHGLGAEAAVAAVAPVGTASAAQASTPQEAPPAVTITAAKNAELCTASLPGSTCTIVSRYKVGRQESTDAISAMPENSDPSGSHATVILNDHRLRRGLSHFTRQIYSTGPAVASATAAPRQPVRSTPRRRPPAFVPLDPDAATPVPAFSRSGAAIPRL